MKFFTNTLLFSILLLIPFVVQAQEEWEDVDVSKLSWSVSNKVSVMSNSLKTLNFWNYNAESKDNKKNKTWSYEKAEMGISWEIDRAWKISFSIKNLHSEHGSLYKVYEYDSNGKQKESWYGGDVYWGFIVSVKNTGAGVDSFKKFYSDSKTINSGHTYLSTYDSNSQNWRVAAAPSFRYVQIIYDGKSTIKVYAGAFGNNQLIQTFNNAKSIRAIEICAGVAANLMVEDFKIQIASEFAHVIPYIKSGDEKYSKEDYWGAIEDYTKAVSAGYHDANLYYKRANAYYCLKFYNNAIDDYTNSLNLRPTEEAYLYRGMSKLNKGDATGIEDLQMGGAKGAALAKELLNSSGGVAQSSKARSEYVS
ncbi:MAG: hypothetical protein Q4B21_07065, partial [Bacteroidia bacterium]|nr:hypothetical protein [Bacteroidia bacterium]